MTSLGYYDRITAYKDERHPRGFQEHPVEDQRTVSLPVLGAGFPVREPWHDMLVRSLYKDSGLFV